MNGVMIITSMFYNRTEIAQRVGWTLQCNGVAQVVSGFVAFGVAHAAPSDRGKPPAQWQILLTVYAGLSLVVGVVFWRFFPDSPITARFLREDEKVQAVRRIRSNQSGIETKVWKAEQAVEAVQDIKTWLFFFLAAIS